MKEVTPQAISRGESYSRILSYFFPELVTAFVGYSLLGLFDAKLIADLQTTSMYATFGVTAMLTHFITKVAEGISVGTLILCGQHNGQGNSRGVGIALVSSLWVTAVIGAVISGILYFAAPLIYSWLGVSDAMAQLGVPYLRLRAVGIFFMFLYFAFIGFLRGIKNTRVPMALFVLGAFFFMFFDWVLVKGRLGFPTLALKGSALAFLIQYVIMCGAAIIYVLTTQDIRKYGINLFTSYSKHAAKEIVALSWPVMIDKGTLAWAKFWLVPRIAPAGELALASFGFIKDLEQLAFVPAIAFGQVITLLVSNDVGAGTWLGVKQDIKKVIILSSTIVFAILLIFSLNIRSLVYMFDQRGEFTQFTIQAFPVISALALLDLLQLILAAALRGAGDVKTVMMVRLVTFFLFFVPIVWLFSILPLGNALVKFILIYGSFYLNNGIMSLIYVKRLSGKEWYHRLTATS